jgi:hypothetical protein
LSYDLDDIAEVLQDFKPVKEANPNAELLVLIANPLVSILANEHPAQLRDMHTVSADDRWDVINTALYTLRGLGIALGPHYTLVWQRAFEHIVGFARSADPEKRLFSVELIGDNLAEMEDAVTPYTELLLPLLLDLIADEDEETITHAIRALGLLCYFTQHKHQVLSHYNTILRQLFHNLSRHEETYRLEDTCLLREVTIGCMARMIDAAHGYSPIVAIASLVLAVSHLLPVIWLSQESLPVCQMILKLGQFSLTRDSPMRIWIANCSSAKASPTQFSSVWCPVSYRPLQMRCSAGPKTLSTVPTLSLL